MSGREWKPGDVAMVAGADGVEERAIYTGSILEWRTASGSGFYRYQVEARPLVTIDPEDREQIERLVAAFSPMVTFAPSVVDRMQAALREFANPTPPRPDEPTAMWSVVVDSRDDQWVRVLGPDFIDGWVRAGDLPNNGKWTCYREIDAVKVIRDGADQ